jgi:transcriptional regulator with XRE-family HTH domain
MRKNMITLTEEKLPTARSSSAQSRELGEELRLVRTQAGLRGTTIAEQLEWSPSWLSKLENGVRRTSDADIASILTVCGATKATRARILRLAQEPDYGFFARPHLDTVPDDLLCLRMHEAQASAIYAYGPMIIPSLLQAGAYAGALFKQSEATEEQRATWLSARVARQAVLLQKTPPDVTVYIHQAALNLVVDSAKVMHDQCMKLSLLADWPTLSIRVVPWSVGHPALQYGATYLTLQPPMKPLVVCESDVVSVFLDQESATTTMQWKFEVLDQLALSPEASQDVFLHWAEIYGHGDLAPRS